jgi:hypothetical protein
MRAKRAQLAEALEGSSYGTALAGPEQIGTGA